MSESTSAANKKLLIIGGVVAVVALLQYQFNIIPIKSKGVSSVPLSVDLKNDGFKESRPTNVGQLELPSTSVSKLPGAPMRLSMYAWTAQLGIDFANGGAKTTQGSLMEKNGVKLQLISQPDLSKSQLEQIKFAEALKAGDANPAIGVHFIITMGDGGAQYLAGINKALVKLGPDYRAEVVGAVGFSGNAVSGEDACMGPAEWQEDPSKAKGGLFAGYLRDGDWNLCMAWAQQNGLLNNPNETTYDPNAINWLSTDDYLKAAEAYISGVCEDRRVVEGGKFTNKPKEHVCVQGVATWTPGDVNIAKKKGGLVKLLSTKENAYQMPAVIIGIHKWDVANPKKVTALLKASFEAADQIKSFDAALNRAGKAAFDVYGEESPAYWIKYYKGVLERDRTNRPVPLGGSRVASLGDNLSFFGLVDGAGDLGSSQWRATYEGFGNIAKQQYPSLVPDFPPVAEATNLTFLQELASTSSESSKVVESDHYELGAITEVVSKANHYDIQFDTGKATISNLAGIQALDALYNQIIVSKLSVEISGHTDNTGAPAANLKLSEARAATVEQYLQKRAPSLFVGGRVSAQGFGDAKPIASNATSEGRALNRRVTVTLGNK